MKIDKIKFLETLKKVLYILISTIIISTLNFISSNSINNIAHIIYTLLFVTGISLIIFKIKDKKLDLLQKLLCLFFAVMIVIGKSFDLFGTLFLIKNYFTFSVISVYFLYYIFTKLFMLLDYIILEKDSSNPKAFSFSEILNQHPFKISLFCIVCIWIIYIISWYPGIVSPDPINELKAFFNISSVITEKANLVNPEVHWTTQHSILHTLNLGVAVNFANLINNANLGFFLIYTLPQLVSMILVFAYSIKFMKNQGVPPKILCFILGLYILAPLYPLYALTAHKTVYYNILIMLYIMQLFDYLKNYANTKYPIKKLLFLTITAILATLFRNEGRYVILLSLPFALLIKNINKSKIVVSILLIISFLFAYENLFIKKMEITSQNSAAYLSIPFQQMARYVYFYEDELSEEDIKIIDYILDYDTLADRYIPQFADPVNLEFNYNATQDDINSFLKVWFKHFLKHPICYLEAFMHQNYTFYYPAPLSWYVYKDDLNTEELQEIIELKYSETQSANRMSQISLAYIEYLYLPGVRYLLYNGTHFWILLIASYYIIKNNSKYLVALIPLYLVFLVCLVGPSNWYRYSLPITFTIPIIIGITSYANHNHA